MPDRALSLPQELEAQAWAVIDLPPSAQGPALERLCAEQPQHAAVLRAFVQRYGESSDPVDSAAAAPPPRGTDSAGPTELPQQIGPYRILEEIGEGGMGTVYRAEQREPVRRLVALKVVQAGMGTKEVLARFQLERRALAAMSHRCIAKVFDAGATDKGDPYFVMELVEGLPLTHYCDKHKLSLPDRLKLFQQVCEGVQHAHLKGVVHRDLKPGNVLVVREGDQALPKILDFGLAKATNRGFVDVTVFTEKDRILGTPEYMSPEQAGGDGELIDARSDIYSLGVMLYELLCGELPFPTETLRRAGQLEALRLIREEEPKKPSTKLATRQDSAVLAGQRQTSTSALKKALASDLDWVVLTAMAKEPERRYDAATALAADLDRYLEHQPVLAGPPSAGYRLKKFLRRYRVQVVAAAAVLVAIVAGGIGTFVQWQRAEQREADALALARSLRLLAGPALLEQAMAPRREGREIVGADAVLALRPEVEAELARLSAVAEPEVGQRYQKESLERFLEELGEFDKRVRIDKAARSHPNARVTWEEARQAILRADGELASELYASRHSQYHPIDLQPQAGLVPIGMNPVTKLWEFYELGSAWDGTGDPAALAIPVHDEEGRIEVRADTGIVFVLLPGGTFWMGAQRQDPNGQNFDPQAGSRESPVHQVTLVPFFLARHEMTQAQWARTWRGMEEDRQPSWFKERADAAVLPVENVDWFMSDRVLRSLGLVLPTEAQWEYGCRAGTITPWCCEEDELPQYTSLLRRELRDGREVFLSDGMRTVGSLRANRFGLHDVHGGVREWCQDWSSEYEKLAREHDGLRVQGDGCRYRVLRGGHAFGPAAHKRSSIRGENAEAARDQQVGLRPARTWVTP